jgi:hypothetical protein
VKDSTFTFTSGLKRIAEFLYRPENINHTEVVYMNPARGIGIFDDKSSGSYIYLEFTEDEQISSILYLLQGEDGIVHRWVRMFQSDFGATVDHTG